MYCLLTNSGLQRPNAQLAITSRNGCMNGNTCRNHDSWILAVKTARARLQGGGSRGDWETDRIPDREGGPRDRNRSRAGHGGSGRDPDSGREGYPGAAAASDNVMQVDRPPSACHLPPMQQASRRGCASHWVWRQVPQGPRGALALSLQLFLYLYLRRSSWKCATMSESVGLGKS